MMFQRLFHNYRRETRLIEASVRRRYRKTDDKLFSLRVVIGLWQQIKAFMQSRMPPESYEAFRKDVETTDRRDAELMSLVENMPIRFAMSQLQSQRQLAQQEAAAREQASTSKVETKAIAVRKARWEHFEEQLRADWESISDVKGAMNKLADLTHVKKVRWMKEKSKAVTANIKSFMDLNCNVQTVARHELIVKPLQEWREMVKEKHGVDDSAIYTVVYVDMNTRNSRSKDKLEGLMSCIQMVNDTNATQSIAFLVMPDRARDPKRGHTDDEATIEKELWALNQHCDTRFVLPFNMPDVAEAHTNMRRFAMGRCIINAEALGNNVWLTSSELCVAGRPLGEHQFASIPRQSELVLPESSNPNEDLRVSERKRPSPDQVSSQRGIKLNSVLLRSIMANMPLSAKDVVLIVNLTSNVEDLGIAVCSTKTKTGNDILMSVVPHMHYMSLHTDPKIGEFGEKRVQQYLIEQWMADNLVLPGCTYEMAAPALTEDEIKTIKGGEVAAGNLSQLRLNVCSFAGGNIDINTDEKRMWTSISDGYKDKFEALEKAHIKHMRAALESLLIKTGGNGGAPGDTAAADIEETAKPETDPAVEEMNDMDALTDKYKEFLYDGPTDIPGVHAHITKDKTLWLIAKTTLASGFGKGQYAPLGDDGDAGIKYEHKDGDKQQVQFEKIGTSSGVETLSFYQMLRNLESEGNVDYEASRLLRKQVASDE